MEIAKGFTSTDYNRLDYTLHETWYVAADLLERRLTERYIEPADKLLEIEENLPPTQKKYGFAILALDCLLIETLQSFYDGQINSRRQSKTLFTNFLMQRARFKTYFTTQQQADKFYQDFRCGILHQDQTFNKTKVRAVGDLIYQQSQYQIVNRLLFHEAIKNEVIDYLEIIRTQPNNPLRSNFRTKMDFIANN